MIVYKTDRRGLLEYLSEDSSPPAISIHMNYDVESLIGAVANATEDGDLLLVWKSEQSVYNTLESFVILVADVNYEDFLAWSATYIGEYVPLTAFFRVVRGSDIERYDLFADQDHWLSPTTLNALSAVAVADAGIFGNSRTAMRNMTLQRCMLTFSFAAVRGLNAGLHPSQIVDLAERWDKLRQSDTSATPYLPAHRALSFWLLATSALIPEEVDPHLGTWVWNLSNIVRSIVSGRFSPDDLSDFAEYPDIALAMKEFNAVSSLPREKQVRVLDESALAIVKSNAPEPFKEAALGLMVSRFSDGSLQYLDLINDIRGDLVCAPLWFVFFAGFQNAFDGLAAFNGMGRHLARRAALRRDVFSKSRITLGYDELMLLAERRNNSAMQTIYGSVIEVELLPGVPVTIANPFRRSAEGSYKRSVSVNSQRVARLLREALAVIEREDGQEGNESTNQSDLFRPVKDGQPNKRVYKKKD